MTQISKVLAIFVTVASLAFMGFAMATTFGGPNWQAVMQADYFKGYRIARSEGPDPIWRAVRGSDEGEVASSAVLPQVLTRVMDEVQQQRQEELQRLNERQPRLEEKIALLDEARSADEQALARYEELQRQRLEETRKKEAETAGRVIAATNEAQKLESSIALRREDVLRLQQEVEELRADQYRLKAIQAQLTDLLNQLDGNMQRAEHREQLLKSREVYSPDPESAPSETEETGLRH